MLRFFLQALLWKDPGEQSYKWPILQETVLWLIFWGLEGWRVCWWLWLGHLSQWEGSSFDLLRWTSFMGTSFLDEINTSGILCLWPRHSLPQHPLLQFLIWRLHFYPLPFQDGNKILCNGILCTGAFPTVGLHKVWNIKEKTSHNLVTKTSRYRLQRYTKFSVQRILGVWDAAWMCPLAHYSEGLNLQISRWGLRCD